MINLIDEAKEKDGGFSFDSLEGSETFTISVSPSHGFCGDTGNIYMKPSNSTSIGFICLFGKDAGAVYGASFLDMLHVGGCFPVDLEAKRI